MYQKSRVWQCCDSEKSEIMPNTLPWSQCSSTFIVPHRFICETCQSGRANRGLPNPVFVLLMSFSQECLVIRTAHNCLSTATFHHCLSNSVCINSLHEWITRHKCICYSISCSTPLTPASQIFRSKVSADEAFVFLPVESIYLPLSCNRQLCRYKHIKDIGMSIRSKERFGNSQSIACLH